MDKRQLKFTLTEVGSDAPVTYSTFHPVGLRAASAIAIRVSKLYGYECVVHEPGSVGDTYTVKFFDQAEERFREFTATIEA